MLRWVGRTALVIALLIGFTALASVLHVRDAVAKGALEDPVLCLNEAHLDWRTGSLPGDQEIRLSAAQVRQFYLGDRIGNSSDWHLRGVFASLGLWLGYSHRERRNMATQIVMRMPDCGI